MRVVPAVVSVVAVAAVAAAVIVVHHSTPVKNAGKVVGYTPPAAAQTLAVIGDSYSSGTAMGGNGSKGWPEILAGLNNLQLSNHAVAGTGYVTNANGGDNTFTDQAKAVAKQGASFVIVWGARDDLGKGTPDSASRIKTVALGMKKTLDDLEGNGAKTGGVAASRILVIGPTWINNHSVPKEYTQLDAAEGQVADKAGVAYVSTLGAHAWFAGNNAALIGSDGEHPTDEGNQHLAFEIQNALKGTLLPKAGPTASDGVPPVVPTVTATFTKPAKAVTATVTASPTATPTVTATVTVAPTATVTVLAPP